MAYYSQDEQVELEGKISKLTKKLTSKEENEAFKKKLAKLEIATKLTKNVGDLIADVEGSLTEFFCQCPAEMQEDEAITYIRNFAKLASTKQDEFQVALNRLLDEDIRAKSQQLLDEYIKKLAAISEEFSADGLTIDLASFVQGKLASLNEDSVLDGSIDSRIEKHKENRTRTVTKERKWYNPMRLFKGDYYEVEESYQVEVKEEIKFISREKLSNQLVAPIRKTLMNERTRILQFAQEETENIKEYFYEQFDEVDDILAKKANELREATTSKKASEEALAKANNLLKQLETVKVELESILEI